MGIELKRVEEEVAAEEKKDDEPYSIPGLCPYCYDEGSTTLTRAEVCGFRTGLTLWTFSCPGCGHESKEIEFVSSKFLSGEGTTGGTGDDAPSPGDGGDGVRFALSVAADASAPRDLARTVVRCETASVSIPELEFEIPPGAHPTEHVLVRGDVVTVQGLLSGAAQNLGLNQHERAPDTAAAVAETIDALGECAAGLRAFTLVLEDQAGNSFVGPRPDGEAAEADDALVATPLQPPSPRRDGPADGAAA